MNVLYIALAHNEIKKYKNIKNKKKYESFLSYIILSFL